MNLVLLKFFFKKLLVELIRDNGMYSGQYLTITNWRLLLKSPGDAT
jgi:hypothetical protein